MKNILSLSLIVAAASFAAPSAMAADIRVDDLAFFYDDVETARGYLTTKTAAADGELNQCGYTLVLVDRRKAVTCDLKELRTRDDVSCRRNSKKFFRTIVQNSVGEVSEGAHEYPGTDPEEEEEEEKENNCKVYNADNDEIVVEELFMYENEDGLAGFARRAEDGWFSEVPIRLEAGGVEEEEEEEV